MAVRRMWVIHWFGLVFLLAHGLCAIGQEWQPLRLGTQVRLDKWNARSCLSAARAALERGDLDEAEAWAQRAENAPLGFMEWVKSPWHNATGKLWREIQEARAKETAALINHLETHQTRETPEPPLTSLPKKTTVSKERTAPAKQTSKDSTWNREDLANLRAYLKNQREAKPNNPPPPLDQASSIELLAAALGQFLQGHYQEAKRLSLRAHEAENTRITTLELPSPKTVEAVQTKFEVVLPEIVDVEPELPPPQASIAFVEEFERPVYTEPPRVVSGSANHWYLGMGISLGVLVCWVFLWWCMPGAKR